MSFTIESTEELLRKIAPSPLSAQVLERLVGSLKAQDVPVFTDEHGRIEKKLSTAEPRSLHPQQFDVFQDAELVGNCEAEWSGSYTPVFPSNQFRARVAVEMDAAEHVEGISPVALRAEFFDRVVAEMDSASSPVEENESSNPKILSFPGQRVRSRVNSASSSLLKIAAAVAIFGAAVGSLIPGLDSDGDLDSSPIALKSANSSADKPVVIEPRVPAYTNLISPAMVPASFSADVRSPRERGLVVDKVNRAHYRVEFDEVEEMVLIDGQGRQRSFERPRGKRELLLPVDTQ